MIHMNQVAFDTYTGNFDTSMTDKYITNTVADISNCDGGSIDDLKACFDSYNELQSSINALFSSTSNYLHKASYNISLCEDSNSI